MNKYLALSVSILALATSIASAGNIQILNPGFETGAGTWWHSPQAGVPGVVTHAQYPAPNNETLGTYFGYYSPGDQPTTWFAQQTSSNYVAGWIYTFKAWMVNGGSVNGFLEFGTCTTPGDWNTYVTITNRQFTLSNIWLEYEFSYTATLADHGKVIVVRFPNKPGNTGGVWIDNIDLNFVVPEPGASLAALAAALLLFRRR